MDDYLKRVLEGRAFLLFDGAMGTMLAQHAGDAGELPDLLCLTHPQAVTEVHRAYVEAGSQVATTNTFGANSRKLASEATVADVYAAAVECARASEAQYVAADIGPIGDLMFPMGDLGFSEAYDLFAEQARAGERAGADLVIIETMSDLIEMTAAVLACRDACDLPVFATMTFTAGGSTFLGTAPVAAAGVLDALGVDALGVNCSAGPADLQPVVFDMLRATSRPVIVQANAGLPEVVDGVTTYSLPPAEYARAVAPMIDAGATVVGGCCGTDPAYVRALADIIAEREPAKRTGAVGVPEGALSGRDAEIYNMVRQASDRPALKAALASEFDE